MNLNKKILTFAFQSRKFQLQVNKNIIDGKIKLPVHLAFGHEFVSALVRSFFLMSKDSLFLTHRNIHYTSIFSKNSRKIYQNFLLNKIQSFNTLGSMNYFDEKTSIKYTSSILGNNLSVAAGFAEGNKSSKSIVYCVVGDGAIEEGSFYETLLLSKSLGLRIVFILENNNFSMATTIKQRRFDMNIKKLTQSIGIKYYYFKRKDIISNVKKYQKIITNTREADDPVVLEFEILTLGSYKDGDNKINYHHGPMKLGINNAYVYNNDSDILYLINKKLSQ